MVGVVRPANQVPETGNITDGIGTVDQKSTMAEEFNRLTTCDCGEHDTMNDKNDDETERRTVRAKAWKDDSEVEP